MDQKKEELARAVRDFQTGVRQEANFRIVFDHSYISLRRYFRGRGLPAEDAADLVNETFLRLWKGLGGVRDPHRLDAFVYTTARRIFIRWLKKKEREDDLEIDEPWAIPSSPFDSPERALLDREQLERLEKEIRLLPSKKEGLAAKLRFLDGSTNREVARVMGISTNYAGVLLHSAKKKLQKILQDRD